MDGGAILARLKTIPYVPSIGGTTTIVSFPPQTPGLGTGGTRTHEPYSSDTIRLSVGLEPANEIIAELDQALRGLADPEEATRPQLTNGAASRQ